MKYNTYIYILIMFAVSYALRALPLTLIRRQIRNRTIRSFLYYVPYVTLAVMTFPAICEVSGTHWAGMAALAIGIALAWFGAGLFPVAAAASAVVFVLELIL